MVESYAIDEARQVSRFYCRIHFDCGVCPRCRNVSKDIHQYDDRSVRDMGCFERKVYLVFRIRRFRCPKCHKVFTESLDSIATNQRCTRRFQQMVYQECLEQTFQHVAKKLGMNWHTVERMFYEKACEQFQCAARQFPQILGVDEISNKKGHKQYLLVITDLQRNSVIEVLPDRLKETLMKWLYSLSIWARDNICVVSMDQWEPYRQAVKLEFRVCRYALRRGAASGAGLRSCSEKGVYLRVESCIIQGRDAQNTVGERDCELFEYVANLGRCLISLKEKVRRGV